MSQVHTQNAYSLPMGYNDNRIVLLARDPHWLYAYWEISDEKRDVFYREFGSDLWARSVPVLKVTNVSKNTSFFIRINEFSSSWYINVEDADSLYVAELGRKISDQFFINMASSNYTITPSDKVSSNTSAYFINYRDLKRGTLDMEAGRIYESYDSKTQVHGMLGPSSPEFFGMAFHESAFGVSSAELFGISLQEHLGISSESFIR